MARVPVAMSVHPNVRWRTFDVNGRIELYRGLLVQFRYVTHIAINRTAELMLFGVQGLVRPESA
jgi:hypothetical protein